MVYGKSPSIPVTPAEPMGMSIPPTTPGFGATWGVGGWGWGAGGVSEPFFVDFPNGENGTLFGSLFATGFGASGAGSGILIFSGVGGRVSGVGAKAGAGVTTLDSRLPTPDATNLML